MPSYESADSLLLREAIVWESNPKAGGQGRIRTSVARKGRQIYSLLPLAARPPVRSSLFSVCQELAKGLEPPTC